MNPNRPQPQNTCDELRNLLPAYVIGATTPEEAERVQKLLPECPEVAKELESYAHITVGLMQQVEPAIPPPNLRNRILEQIEQESQPTSRPSTSSPRYNWWQVAAAVLVIAMLLSNIFWINQLSTSQADIQTLQNINTQIIELIANPQLQQIALQATQEQDETVLANLLWDSESNSVTLVTDQLPTLDSTQTYQIWLIAEGDPISGGLFRTDTQNQALLSIELDTQLTQYSAIAISVEPASGSELPTSDPIALAEISA